jgi:AICAR transformylase/IMP cyclohydrolase PurH
MAKIRHQAAAFYVDPGVEEPASPRPGSERQGTFLNNLSTRKARSKRFAILADLRPRRRWCKHTNPAEMALGDRLEEAYVPPRECEPEAAFAESRRSAGPWTSQPPGGREPYSK